MLETWFAANISLWHATKAWQSRKNSVHSESKRWSLIAFNEEGVVQGPSSSDDMTFVKVRFSGGTKGNVRVGSISKTKQV